MIRARLSDAELASVWADLRQALELGDALALRSRFGAGARPGERKPVELSPVQAAQLVAILNRPRPDPRVALASLQAAVRVQKLLDRENKKGAAQ
jgi:hypothetical protein